MDNLSFYFPFPIFPIFHFLWSPTGKARGTSIEYPPTPLGAEALRRASAKALACQRTCSASRSEGYPPSAKSAEAAILEAMNNSDIVYAFIHGQSPWFSAWADKITPLNTFSSSGRRG